MDKTNMASFLTFDSCCGCMSLRTGSFVVAYTYLVFEIIICSIYGFGMAPFVVGILGTDIREQEVQFMTLLLFMSVAMLLAMIMFGFIIALLVGLHMNKRGPVLAFLIGCAAFIIVDLLTFIVSCFYNLPAVTVVYRVVSLVLQIFFWLVIRSYYYKMETDKGVMINTA